MNDTNSLIALKSIFELGKGFKGFNPLLANISNHNLSKKILSEFRRKNIGNVISIIDRHLFENVQNSVRYEIKDIKQFDFVYLENSSLIQIKETLELSQLNLNIVKTEKGEETNLLRYWDNLNRYAILIEKDLVEEIKQNKEIRLTLFKEIVLANLGYYTKLTIDKFDPNKSNSEDKNDENYHWQTYDDYNGSYAQDYAGYSDQLIDDVFDGDADLYWNID